MKCSSLSLIINLVRLCTIIRHDVFAQAASFFINAGGPDFVDDDGNMWVADAEFVNTGEISESYDTIGGTNNPTLYQTERWDPPETPSMRYEIPLLNVDLYKVSLNFVETYFEITQPGQRIFDVKLEGSTVFSSVDIYAEAGNKRNTAVIKSTTIFVQDGILTIEFVHGVGYPMVSGIEIHSVYDEAVSPTPSPVVSDVSPTPSPVSWTTSSGVAWIDMNEDEGYTARHECSFVQAGNKFYLFGGREDPTKLEAYDYTTNTWSVGAKVPLPFNHFQATEYQGLIWVIGAFEDNEFPTEKPAEYVSVYDPANNVWMQGPRILFPRGGAGLVVYEEKFYLVGGNTKGHADGYVPWLDEYNPVTGQWRSLPDASHARDHFHAAVVGNALYAVGGRRTSAQYDTFWDTVAEVDVYDFGSGKWRTTNVPDNLPTPRAGTSTAVLNGKILVMGGESNIQTVAHNEVHALDPTSGTWSTLDSMNHGRHGTQAIVSGQGIYIVAGSPMRGEGNQKNMEVYNMDIPSGEVSVAGSLSAPSSLGILVGVEEEVGIQHVGGNQGVFVNSIALTGQNASDFQITSGDIAPILIPKGATLALFVKYNGGFDGAQARLDVMFSGNQTLSIALVGKYLTEVPISASFPLPMHTPLPMTVPVEQPILAQAPQPPPPPPPLPLPPPPPLAISKFFFVDAQSNVDISTLVACNGCIEASTLIDIRAEPFEAVGSVKLTLEGPVSLSRVENSAPFALVGDVNGVYSGMILSPGSYTATAQAFSLADMGGVAGPIESASFSITS